MTARQTYWLVDETGDHAFISGAAERDRMVLDGWVETAEPDGDAFVHIWREGIPTPGRVPVSSLRALWEPRGWHPGPPPGGAHPFGSAGATDIPAEVAPIEAKKSAASGDSPRGE